MYLTTTESEKIVPFIFKEHLELELDESEPYKNMHSVKSQDKDDSFARLKIDLVDNLHLTQESPIKINLLQANKDDSIN